LNERGALAFAQPVGIMNMEGINRAYAAWNTEKGRW
jgi:hypothetical protein